MDHRGRFQKTSSDGRRLPQPCLVSSKGAHGLPEHLKEQYLRLDRCILGRLRRPAPPNIPPGVPLAAMFAAHAIGPAMRVTPPPNHRYYKQEALQYDAARRRSDSQLVEERRCAGLLRRDPN